MSDRRQSRFATTQWSLVLAAADDGSEPARSALAELCETYWHPLYAYARRTGSDPDDARDLTQGFFAELLAKRYVAQADSQRGRFRTFLLAAFRHFRSKQRDRDRAQKRGGDRPLLSLDYDGGEQSYAATPSDPSTPEDLYERRWAMALLDRVMAGMQQEYRDTGRGALFACLEPTLTGTATTLSYKEIGARMGMSEAAVKVAAHRLRRRYHDRLRAVVAATVADPSSVDDELRYLIEVVARP